MEAGAGKQTFDARATAREQTRSAADCTDDQTRCETNNPEHASGDPGESSGQPSVDRYARPEPLAPGAAEGHVA